MNLEIIVQKMKINYSRLRIIWYCLLMQYIVHQFISIKIKYNAFNLLKKKIIPKLLTFENAMVLVWMQAVTQTQPDQTGLSRSYLPLKDNVVVRSQYKERQVLHVCNIIDSYCKLIWKKFNWSIRSRKLS